MTEYAVRDKKPLFYAASIHDQQYLIPIELPLLDTRAQKSPSPQKRSDKRTARRGRLYHRMRSGILWHKKQPLRFMTLTSANGSRDLNDHWHALLHRIRRLTPYRLYKEKYLTFADLRRYYPDHHPYDLVKFEYLKVETTEGNGVVHILFYGSYIPFRWLQKTWEEIHGAFHVNIQLVSKGGDARAVTSYIYGQYVAGQDAIRHYGYSRGWVYMGFVTRWLELRATYGHHTAIMQWEAEMLAGVRYCYQLTLGGSKIDQT